jgi:hypothetical protein
MDLESSGNSRSQEEARGKEQLMEAFDDVGERMDNWLCMCLHTTTIPI